MLPLHHSGTHLDSTMTTSSTFMRFTMANMARASGAMWCAAAYPAWLQRLLWLEVLLLLPSAAAGPLRWALHV